jgi:hypothetical protein
VSVSIDATEPDHHAIEDLFDGRWLSCNELVRKRSADAESRPVAARADLPRRNAGRIVVSSILLAAPRILVRHERKVERDGAFAGQKCLSALYDLLITSRTASEPRMRSWAMSTLPLNGFAIAADTGFPCVPWFERDPLLEPLRRRQELSDLLAYVRTRRESSLSSVNQ